MLERRFLPKYASAKSKNDDKYKIVIGKFDMECFEEEIGCWLSGRIHMLAQLVCCCIISCCNVAVPYFRNLAVCLFDVGFRIIVSPLSWRRRWVSHRFCCCICRLIDSVQPCRSNCSACCGFPLNRVRWWGRLLIVQLRQLEPVNGFDISAQSQASDHGGQPQLNVRNVSTGAA